MRSFCYRCGVAAGPTHASTLRHRQAMQETFAPLPKGRPGWMTAIRRYDAQYSEADPGNSPAWDAEQAATA